MAEEQHFYGGQAVLEGVMMRSRRAYATAVRRADGSVIVGRRCIRPLAQRWRWARWPLLRGTFTLLDSLALGMESLSFSANIAVQDEERAAEERAAAGAVPDSSAAPPRVKEATPEAIEAARDALRAAREAPEPEAPAEATVEHAPARSAGMSSAMLWLSMIPAFAIGIGLFVLLPTWAVNWVLDGEELAIQSANAADIFLRNLVEGGFRFLFILAYLAGIGLMPAIRRVFQYHGAEHQTINAFERGLEVTVANALSTSPLHPRCGTAFLLVVILVKILVNCFLGWPTLWLRLLLRLAVLPLIAGVGYEIIYYAGRHRQGLLARALAWPGMMLQRLTTRTPDASQVETAVYALAAVAPEVKLPIGMEPAPEVGIGPSGQILPEPPPEEVEEEFACEAVSE